LEFCQYQSSASCERNRDKGIPAAQASAFRVPSPAILSPAKLARLFLFDLIPWLSTGALRAALTSADAAISARRGGPRSYSQTTIIMLADWPETHCSQPLRGSLKFFMSVRDFTTNKETTKEECGHYSGGRRRDNVECRCTKSQGSEKCEGDQGAALTKSMPNVERALGQPRSCRISLVSSLLAQASLPTRNRTCTPAWH